MIFLWDLFFILFYLALDAWTIQQQNCKIRVYLYRYRYIMNWLQFSIVLIYVYARPVHNQTEREVSFSVMFITKIIMDIILYKRLDNPFKKP